MHRYVEMLENQQSQLVDALQEMCKRMQSGHGWPGSPLGKTSHGISLANEILENARLLKLEDNDTSVNFHEDRHTENSEHRASGDRTNASKNPQPGTYRTISPAFELLPSKSEFSKLFPPSDFPPTPDESPPLQSSRTVTQNEALQYSHPATQPELAWSREPSKAADPVDVISQYDSSEMGNNTAFTSFVVRMDNEQMAPTVINPIFANGTPHCVIVSPKALCREWPPEDSDYADSWIAVTSQNPHGGAF